MHGTMVDMSLFAINEIATAVVIVYCRDATVSDGTLCPRHLSSNQSEHRMLDRLSDRIDVG